MLEICNIVESFDHFASSINHLSECQCFRLPSDYISDCASSKICEYIFIAMKLTHGSDVFHRMVPVQDKEPLPVIFRETEKN